MRAGSVDSSWGEVWITGVGAVTSFGRGGDALARGLSEGRCAAAPPWAFRPVASEWPPLAEYREHLPAPPGVEDDRGLALLWDAFRQLQPTLDGARLHRAGVFLGTGLSSLTPKELEEDVYPHLQGGGISRSSVARDLACRAGAPHRHIPHRGAELLARHLGTDHVSTSFSACAASAQAIAEASRAVRRGAVDLALAGGHDSMTHPLGVLSFVVLGALTWDTCRPFDPDRSGFLLGEGAALLVLESPRHARARGAVPLGRILGAGTSADAHGVTDPHPDGHGALLAMSRALRDAGISPGEVDHVHAHGTGTPRGDQAEALAISRLLPPNTPVSSTKGALGHTIAAAGAVSLAASVAAMAAGFTPGTVGFQEPDPRCPVRVLRDPVPVAPQVVLSNAFGFGGQNATLVLAHPDRAPT